MQLRLSFPLAVPSLPGSTGWGLVCSGGVSRVVLMTQGIHLQFPSAGRPGLSSSGSYLAPVLGQETVGWISGGGC